MDVRLFLRIIKFSDDCDMIFLQCSQDKRTRVHPSSIIKSEMMMPATAPPPIVPDFLVLDVLYEFGGELFVEFTGALNEGLTDGFRPAKGAIVGDLLW